MAEELTATRYLHRCGEVEDEADHGGPLVRLSVEEGGREEAGALGLDYADVGPVWERGRGGWQTATRGPKGKGGRE